MISSQKPPTVAMPNECGTTSTTTGACDVNTGASGAPIANGGAIVVPGTPITIGGGIARLVSDGFGSNVRGASGAAAMPRAVADIGELGEVTTSRAAACTAAAGATPTAVLPGGGVAAGNGRSKSRANAGDTVGGKSKSRANAGDTGGEAGGIDGKPYCTGA